MFLYILAISCYPLVMKVVNQIFRVLGLGEGLDREFASERNSLAKVCGYLKKCDYIRSRY